MANYGTLGVATVFAALGLLLVAVSFATDHWVDTSVDREDLAVAVSQVSTCVCVCVCACTKGEINIEQLILVSVSLTLFGFFAEFFFTNFFCV